MTVSLDDHLKKLTPEQRARIEARTKELIEEELTLRDLRQAQHLTQDRMAELMASNRKMSRAWIGAQTFCSRR
jgi:DNA-binding transcriptional regulator YiaG